MISNKLFLQKIKKAPMEPGCYIWKQKDSKVLYVGKAVNLKKRISSYLVNYKRLDPKIKSMIDQVSDIDYYTVDNEVEALILETNLIKKYRPKYNRLMKDDKNYTWIKIDWYKDYPSIQLVRDKNDKKSEYYGPYPSRFPIIKVLEKLRKLFPYCTSLPLWINTFKEIKNRYQKKPCFDFHIGLCSGVCANLVSKTQHRKNIKYIRDFLKGKKQDLIEVQKKNMKRFADNLEFEKAQVLKVLIADFEYTTQRIKIKSYVDENILSEIKQDGIQKAFEQLRSKLGYEIAQTARIECYDISNIQGKFAVGSMVVFQGGKKDTSLYRKFKIKLKSTPDDFAMMQEVLTRRLNYLSRNIEDDKSLLQKPDLIIVDGGKGQLSSAYQVLEECKSKDINIIGLAKKEEEIFKIFRNENFEIEFEKVILTKRSEALYMVQRIRDEAHRFAISYHKNLRSKAQTKSILDDITGIGVITKKRLLKAFGSIEQIKKASLDELNSVIRNKNTLEALFKAIHS